MVAWLWSVNLCEQSREEKIFDSEGGRGLSAESKKKKEGGRVSIVFLSEILTEIIFSLPP